LNETISDNFLTQCIHCGLCLPVCPTYALTGLERNSPRGRIRLMKGVMDGTLSVADSFMEEMYFCLDCQACQTACPAGVKYGELIEAARTLVEGKKKLRLKNFVLRNVVERRKVLIAVAIAIRFLQNSFVGKITMSLLRGVFPNLYERASLMPKVASKFAFGSVPEKVDPVGEIRGVVSILTGCVMDIFYADVNRDTIDVLLVNGWQVVIPRKQVCCGSLGGHNGDLEYSKGLARKNIEAFEDSGADYYVVNSSGCSAFMKRYDALLSDDPEYFGKARVFVSKVKDFSEFIYETGFRRPLYKTDELTTYHEPCHLVHAQGISEQPRFIVREIAGKNYRELTEASWCCGSAGIYNVIRYNDSVKLLSRKIQNIKDSSARLVVTGNPGCLAQIAFGVRKEKAGEIEVLHPATILSRLYRLDAER
jgi:glycolate oxidase iron-sulfur subunit